MRLANVKADHCTEAEASQADLLLGHFIHPQLWIPWYAGGPNGIFGRLPEFSLPQLPEGFRPPRSARASTFEVLYLDEDTRITRGNRGELRVFLRT